MLKVNPSLAQIHGLYILHTSYSWSFSFYKENYLTEAFCSMRSRHSSALVKGMCNPLEKIRVLCSLHARALSGNFAYSIRGYLIWDLPLDADPLIREMIGKHRTKHSSNDLYDLFTKVKHYIKRDSLLSLFLSALFPSLLLVISKWFKHIIWRREATELRCTLERWTRSGCT